MEERRRLVHILTTGGTIDKDYGNGLGVRDMSIGKPFAPDFYRSLVGTGLLFDHPARMHKDSLDFNDSDRKWVVDECRRAKSDKIIITHGTDTMLLTAKAIHDSGLGKSRKIVLTGALRPAVMRNSDAEFNLGLALGVCLGHPAGVWIALNGVHLWDKCYKHESGLFVEK